MILHCSFEELGALNACVERVLAGADRGGIAAPPDVLPDLEALAGHLTGDISLDSLAAQQSAERALAHIVEDARDRLDSAVLDQYPGAEGAVEAYFEYANVLTVYRRLRAIGDEMRAIIELVTGGPPSPGNAATVSFED